MQGLTDSNSTGGSTQPNQAINPKEWPVAEGRYKTGNPKSPVAVCTMASVDMELPMDKIAIMGKCVTENLGIEKIIRNSITNPSIRYILFCGKESQGHFVGQAVKSLKENGIDKDKRIIGARGGMPILKNLNPEDIDIFRQQVEPVDMSGETDTARILARVNELFDKDPGPFRGKGDDGSTQPNQAINPKEAEEGMEAEEDVMESRAEPHPTEEWVKDPQGYFTIRPDPGKGEIVAEHHENSGRLVRRMSGISAEDLYHHIIRDSLISRQDHAAYLGRELAKAEAAMKNGLDYEQDSDLKTGPSNNEQAGKSPGEPQGKDQESQEKETSHEAGEKPAERTHERAEREPGIVRPVAPKPFQRPPQKKERYLTYFKGFKEIQLVDSTNPDNEFRALLRERGLSRVF